MLDNTESVDLAALLVWYREMGVDQAAAVVTAHSTLAGAGRGRACPGPCLASGSPGRYTAPVPGDGSGRGGHDGAQRGPRSRHAR